MNFILRRKGLGRTSCRTIHEKSKTGIEVIRNDMAEGRHGIPEGNIVFRWGCTSNVHAKTIVNEAKVIHLVSDKKAFRILLDGHGLCPKTWADPKEATFPCVVRPRVHHQGRQLFLCKDRQEMTSALHRVEDGYVSKYIDKTSEYRVFVVQGRVACVARKYPNADGGVAWNVYQGGKFENVRWGEWPLKAVKKSIEAYQLSGLDFGGVDAMIDAAGEVYILEINAAPSLTSPYRQECFAKAFDYIVENGKKDIPLIEKIGGYRKFIHPAIDREALLR